jgi:hypothetical protein
MWGIALYVAETWTIRKVYQRCLEGFEGLLEKDGAISWTDRVKNEEVLQKRKGTFYIQ